MPDVSFSTWITGLAADTLSGAEKFPLLDVDGTTSKHATAALLAAFTIDQLHQASVIDESTLTASDELNVFQSDIEKIITAQNFFDWIVDKLEALSTETTIVDGDKLVFNDGGVLKQIDIATVRTFLNSGAVSLGAQINGLSAATLADSDQYVVAQGSAALKTTFAAIAARVHSQFLTYLTSLPAVATLADADTFYVDDGGVRSKVTAQTIATYVQAEVGTAIVSAAWDTYSALGAAANATDVFLLERSSTGRTATGANLATYVVSTLNTAADAVATVASDDFVIFRSGTQMKLDVSFVASYVLASAWSATSGNPVTGDKIAIGRGGVTYSVTVDQLKTFALFGIQATVLDLTGLTSATLASGSLFLVGDGATARKATLADLETKLWTDYGTYVGALTSHTLLADANTFYVLDGTTPKKITAANMAAYIELELWSVGVATPTAVQAGDNLYMRRGSTSYRLDVGALATYVNTTVAANMDMSGLGNASLSAGDFFLVDEGGGANTKVTLANLKTEIYDDFDGYVTGLTVGGSVLDTDVLYLLRTGSPRQVTIADFLSATQTFTGVKTFGAAGNVGKLVIAGNTSGSTVLNAAAVAGSGTVVLPTTGTLATLAGVESLTNKTLTTPVITGLPTGTGVASTATVSTLASRDANANVAVNNALLGYTTTATAVGNTVLTAASTQTQIFTGSTTQTLTLPVTNTLALGFTFRVVNNSTGAVTVNSSGGNAVLVMRPSSEAVFTCVLTTGTTAASWMQDQITTKSFPQNSQSAAYTTTISDANCHIYHPSADTTARTWTIDSNANVPYPIGTQLIFVNDTSAGVITISITSDTLLLAGGVLTGNRTLAAQGIATAIKVTATRWIISGTGLT